MHSPPGRSSNGNERSGPPVRLPERRGFGSTVIETMAKQTVSGEVQLNYASSGLEWREGVASQKRHYRKQRRNRNRA
jgi:two-component sensor histidine kinase